jgi:hypothetical protein
MSAQHQHVFSLLVMLGFGWILTARAALDPSDYWNERSAFLQEERDQFLGSTITLSPAETRANIILMAAKANEFDKCFDPLCFPPARHFFSAKSDIEASEVFKIIKQMPKGSYFIMQF